MNLFQISILAADFQKLSDRAKELGMSPTAKAREDYLNEKMPKKDK